MACNSLWANWTNVIRFRRQNLSAEDLRASTRYFMSLSWANLPIRQRLAISASTVQSTSNFILLQPQCSHAGNDLLHFLSLPWRHPDSTLENLWNLDLRAFVNSVLPMLWAPQRTLRSGLDQVSRVVSTTVWHRWGQILAPAIYHNDGEAVQ